MLDISLTAYHASQDDSSNNSTGGWNNSSSLYDGASSSSFSSKETNDDDDDATVLFTQNNGRVPVLTLYNILVSGLTRVGEIEGIKGFYSPQVIYLFLPIPRKDFTVATGAAASLVCLIVDCVTDAVSGAAEDGAGRFVKQIAADVVFYASLNLVGFYFRYVGEVNMRRGFLDKIDCVKTTFKLKYEKDQEVRVSAY